MNFISILILLGLLILLAFQIKGFIIAIKNRKNKNIKNQNSNKGDEK